MDSQPMYYFSGVTYTPDVVRTTFAKTVFNVISGDGLEVVCVADSGNKTPDQILESLENDFKKPVDERKGGCSMYVKLLSFESEELFPKNLKDHLTTAVITPSVVQNSDGDNLSREASEAAIETAVAFLEKFQNNTMLAEDMTTYVRGLHTPTHNKVGLDKQTLTVFNLAANMLAKQPFIQKPVAALRVK